MRPFWRYTIALLTTLSAVTALQAQSPNRRPSTAEIIARLQRPITPPLALSRRFGPLGGTAPERGVGLEGPPPPSLDLEVNFAFNSAQLLPDAREVLDNLGTALTDPTLRGARFRLAGHTDGQGSDAYNQRLSLARARSVAEYLGQQHGIAGTRLTVEGYGKRRLLYPAEPLNALNRRVEVTNLGDTPSP